MYYWFWHQTGWIHSQGKPIKQKDVLLSTTQLLQDWGLGIPVGIIHIDVLSLPFVAVRCMLLVCLSFLLYQSLLSQHPQIGTSSILQTSIQNPWYYLGTVSFQTHLSNLQQGQMVLESLAPADVCITPSWLLFWMSQLHRTTESDCCSCHKW